MRIGFCCILLGNEASSFKKTTMTWCKKNPDLVSDRLTQIYSHNLSELSRVITWCKANSVKLYRISSDLFPLADHEIGQETWQNFKSNKCWETPKKVVSDFIKNYGGRLTSHPSQYVSLGSLSEKVREASIKNLQHHAEVFDLLGLPQNRFAAINIHLNNGKCGTQTDFIKCFDKSFSLLDDNITNRLTLENEDKGCWTVENITQYFPQFSVVFDTLHHSCNSGVLSFEKAYKKAFETWNEKVLTHHSEGINGPKDRRHSDFIVDLPKYSEDVDIEVEAKMKNLAIAPFIK
jgi:UV DNA damage endonuclease